MDDRQAASLLKTRDGILVLTHRQPDGDTIGCAAALCAALRKLGKTAYIAPNEEAHVLFTPYLEGYLAPPDYRASFIVSVDIADLGLFPRNNTDYTGKVDLAIDHHPSNTKFGKENCVDFTCASCGELLYRILCELGPITPDIALPLYVAVSTDTGCFAYPNTTPQTHRVAAALMETGIDYALVNKRHFRTKSQKRLQLECMMINQMQCYDDGTLAVASVTLDMLAAVHAVEEDLEDISAFIGQLEKVKTAVTLRELHPGECKISVRTSNGLNASDICAQLGGGGHAAAGGCTVYGTVTEARDAILNAIRSVQNG